MYKISLVFLKYGRTWCFDFEIYWPLKAMEEFHGKNHIIQKIIPSYNHSHVKSCYYELGFLLPYFASITFKENVKIPQLIDKWLKVAGLFDTILWSI